jgi:hypothetical protein
MRDMLFAASWRGAFVLAASSANAQSVPGRPLLDFHVGALVEAPALATQTGGGVYNPAAILLPVTLGAPGRTRASVGRLSSRGERGLDGQIASVAYVPRPRWGAALNFTRVAVDGIDKTETTPETIFGTAIYDALVASAVGAWRFHPHVAAGLAVRHRLGRADTTRASRTGGDVGVVADGLLGRYDMRLAASSYLWSPNAEPGDRPAFLAAADARVYGATPTGEARVGYSYEESRGGGTESYLYASGRFRYFEARGGVTRIASFGDRVTHARFGVGLHYARFSAGVAQETGGWLGSIFQFTLSTVFR